MNEKQQARAQSSWTTTPIRCGPWTLTRVEIISTVQPTKWPVASVELLHETSGHKLGIATGAGGMDAALNAIADIIGKDAEVIELHAGPAAGVAANAVHMRVRIDGLEYDSQADCGDLIISTLAAFIEAICSADRDICALPWKSACRGLPRRRPPRLRKRQSTLQPRISRKSG
jgi:hypothetical protein